MNFRLHGRLTDSLT